MTTASPDRGRPRSCVHAIGDRFGRLTVIATDATRLVTVRCDCGAERQVEAYRLKTTRVPGDKSVTSCGRSCMTGTRRATVGDRFGRLVVTEIDAVGSRSTPAVVLRCDCGASRRATHAAVLAGHRTCCGYQCGLGRMTGRRQVIFFEVGERFGSLTVIGTDRQMVALRCDCGNEIEAEGSRVRPRRGGPRVSCGRLCPLSPRKHDGYQFERRILGSLLARKTEREITLTVEDVRRIRGASCHYCDGPLPALGGFDRIDNDRGYHADNVVPCCYACNSARSAWFTYEEFRAVMKMRRDRLGPGVPLWSGDENTKRRPA